jgi:hypothetical protein
MVDFPQPVRWETHWEIDNAQYEWRPDAHIVYDEDNNPTDEIHVDEGGQLLRRKMTTYLAGYEDWSEWQHVMYGSLEEVESYLNDFDVTKVDVPS